MLSLALDLIIAAALHSCTQTQCTLREAHTTLIECIVLYSVHSSIRRVRSCEYPSGFAPCTLHCIASHPIRMCTLRLHVYAQRDALAPLFVCAGVARQQTLEAHRAARGREASAPLEARRALRSSFSTCHKSTLHNPVPFRAAFLSPLHSAALAVAGCLSRHCSHSSPAAISLTPLY